MAGMFRPLLLLVLASCSSKSEPLPEPPPPVDAAVPLDTITEIGSTDPDRFLDPDPARRTPATKPQRNRPARPIDIILKSSPPGAEAAVDGVSVGRTPAYWYGDADGREHEFTFVMHGHDTARYRFVPIQSGTVHAKLDVVDNPPPVDPVTAPKPTNPSLTDPTPAPLETPKPVDTPKPPDTVITPDSGSGSAGSGSSQGGDFGGFPGAKGPQPRG